jgi:hypothetical protein
MEVLDWGGSGKPVVLLAGLGYTAHVSDDFAESWLPPGVVVRGKGSLHSVRTDPLLNR